jgi:MFS-type transporter involved in bile tolerance (Atg22 family)
MSLPPVIVMPFALMGGGLAARFGKRRVLLIGIALMF